MLATVLVSLALSPWFVLSYNVDTSYPDVYENPTSEKSDYFGYSVSLATSSKAPFLLIGAPNTANGTGKVYRYSLKDQEDPLYQRLEPENSKTVKPRWMGGSIATGEDSEFMVCAPQTLAACIPGAPYDKALLMQGACYRSTLEKNTLHHEDDPTNFNDPGNFSIVEGFSVHYAKKVNSRGVTRIVGQPGVNNIHTITDPDVTWVNEWDDANGLDQLGYSLSSGQYFGTSQLRFAAGAPSWLRTGTVMIFTHLSKNKSIEIQIKGSVLGEYFGASLATGDFNGDGCDDLAVGAPHSGKKDSGRVYTYHGSKSGTLSKVGTLEGKAANGLFGYTLASSDLDKDGFADLVVSAPWEDSGVVYVYYGSSEFGKENSPAPIMQKIKSTDISNHVIQRFGFSLSRPVDIDGNGYPDLAIGAYKSGHVVVLHSRTVITTNIKLTAYPNLLEKTDEKFIVSICPGLSESQELSFNMTVDRRYNRALNGSLIRFDYSFNSNKQSCINQTISLNTSKISSVADDAEIPSIDIEVTHELKKDEKDNKIAPVLNRKNVNEKKTLTVSFNTGCEYAPKCHPKLLVMANFSKGRADNTWVAGSGDVAMNVVVVNKGEPAFQTRVTIIMPPGVQLRKIIEQCKESAMGDIVTLSCDITDPIRRGKSKSIDIDLNMGNVVVTKAKDQLHFTMEARTKDDEQTDPFFAGLNAKSISNISLTGTTDKKDLKYDWSKDDAKVTVQHMYQVFRSGPTPIQTAYLTIQVPTSMKSANYSFLEINDPKLIDGSETTHRCSINKTDTSSDGIPRRRRRSSRDAADDNNETPVTDEKEKLKRTIYLNCSTESVECTFVKCHFRLRRPMSDVGNMLLNMTLDTSVFDTSNEDPPTIEFNTIAKLEFDGQTFSDFGPPAERWANVSTTLNHSVDTEEPRTLAAWILPCSIILGILLLCLLAFILYKAGFFKRSKKLEAAKASSTDPELTLHVGDDNDDVGERTSLHNG